MSSVVVAVVARESHHFDAHFKFETLKKDLRRHRLETLRLGVISLSPDLIKVPSLTDR